MKQFEFEAVNRTRGNIERIRATAMSAAIARAHIVNYYGSQFDVLELYCNIYAPHEVLGEIDCSDAEIFAHIYKTRNKQWSLIISDSAQINGNHVISETLYATKPEAKKAAKLLNAKPWNY